MKSIVSEKGQVTIPKLVRHKLGLVPGSSLEWEAAGGQLVGRKRVEQDVFSKWRGRGKLPGKMNVDQYLKVVRDADGN